VSRSHFPLIDSAIGYHMKMINQAWSLAKYHKLQKFIDPKPQYQRGSVWSPNDKQLLIDSILRHFDVPKIYLRSVVTGAFKYEVADGQQRLQTIWDFMDDKFPVSDDCKLTGCAKKLYSELPSNQRKDFDKFTLVTAIATQATSSEIRELFQRLQRGVQLSQPEIRNAIPSQLGDLIRSMAINHPFFPNSAFSLDRYKADDLIAHAFLMELRQEGTDAKAPQLRELYRNFAGSVPTSITRKVAQILDFMHQMQSFVPKCITLKWGFVDLYWVLSEAFAANQALDPAEIAKRYVAFESRRLKYVSRPEELLAGKSNASNKSLFNYIEAFKTSGGMSDNLRKRHDVLVKVLL
jgi:hypothetical protein